MTFWLGRPGALVALPHPARSIKADLGIPSKVSQTIGGGQTVDRAPTGRRTYELAWPSLTPEQHSLVEEFYLGARGSGPFALIDPWRRNLLTANQSSATSVTNDVTGFRAFGGETLASSTTMFERGPRALAWSLPAVVTDGILVFDPSTSSWPGIPVVPGQTYRLSARVRGGGTDPIVSVAVEFGWMNSAGTQFQWDDGATVATSSAAWADVSATFTAPAGAVYVQPKLVALPGSVSAAAIVYVDKPMLSITGQFVTGTSWVLGTGVPMVSCVESPTEYRAPIRRGAGLTLAEVG